MANRWLAWESLLIGLLGTFLAAALAIGFAFLAWRPIELIHSPETGRAPIRAMIRFVARLAMAVARSVPEIVWAFLFVRIFGLGPGAAVFAIALTFGGIIGKLYAELAESVDPTPPRALRAAGASQFATFLYGVLPQVRRQWLGYALFRLECAIRSASVLGIVGAGGLGSEIDLSVRYFQYDKLATALLAVLLFIFALELASWLLRRSPARIAVSLFSIGTAVAIATLPIPWAAITSNDALAQVRLFFSDLSRPNVDTGFVWNSFLLVVETIEISLVATIVAAILALTLSPLTARTWWQGHLESPPSKSRAVVARVLSGAVRMVLQVARAIPDLVWALLMVVWVGPGVTAGILALTIHTTGILGRLFSDVVEEADPSAPALLEMSGASRLGCFVVGILPGVLPRLAAFALFRFEVNVRAAAMIGFVGAGGLGDALHTAISLFHASDLATLMLVLLVTVVAIDALGDQLRARLRH